MPERPITFVCLDCARLNRPVIDTFDSLNEAWRHIQQGHEVQARTNDDDCLPEEKL